MLRTGSVIRTVIPQVHISRSACLRSSLRTMTFSARMMAQASGHHDSVSSGSSTRTQSPASTLRMPYDALQEVSAEFSGEENVERLRKLQYNFRSDTFSMQTDAQMLAALRASRGDNVYNEDEDTIALEERVAKMCGKEAAMFAVSGTLTNQLAIRTHLHQPPYSLICDFRAHVHKMEAGGIAMFTGATTHQLFPSNDIHLTAEDIEPHLELGDNIHIAPTALICLENTLSGTVLPQEEILKIKALSAKHDIALHLDGARLWNVAAKVITDRGLDATSEETRRKVMTELVEPFDTASLCLSKGIGAPIGSMLVGTKAFIKKARWFRKMYGAGVRQIGMCSAAADYALTHHFPRLEFTHKMAQRMEQGLRDLGCDILAPVDTSMDSLKTKVFWDPQPIGLTMDAVMARLQAHDPPIHCLRERIVMHHQVSPDAIEAFIHIVKEMKEEVEAKGPIVNKQAAKGLKEDFKSEGKLRKKVLGY